MSKWIAIAAVILACVSCDRTPDHVIKPKEMASLLADIHKGEGVVDLQGARYRNDSVKKALKQSIYMRHGVTQEEVDTSLVWYGHNIDVYKEVYEMVIKQLEEELNNADIAADGKSVQVSVVGDSVNVWGELPYRRFSPQNPSDFIRFKFNSDENWEKGDTYSWKLYANSHILPINWTLCADYSDGSTDYISSKFIGSGWQEIKLYTDTARILRSIYGSVQYMPVKDETTYIDSITLTRTRFSPDEYYRGTVRHYNNAK
ncbi:MAG: DUF4296 domain-containing protein [Bacteroides sp.]|nr:DUF4296 domain-containing protein [Bacteroides sp.]MCM1390754.1 DUF4296 domain-containing protein [Bacteroides sp.]